MIDLLLLIAYHSLIVERLLNEVVERWIVGHG